MKTRITIEVDSADDLTTKELRRVVRHVAKRVEIADKQTGSVCFSGVPFGTYRVVEVPSDRPRRDPNDGGRFCRHCLRMLGAEHTPTCSITHEHGAPLVVNEECCDAGKVVRAARQGKSEERKRLALAQFDSENPHLVGQDCHASRGDGECFWASCPQLRDDEPKKTGRHCPLDRHDDE